MTKYIVDGNELLRLKEVESVMNGLEREGVEHWEGYDFAMERVAHDFPKVTDLEKAYKPYEPSYSPEEGRTIYYNNNKARFVKDMGSKLALIIVEARPDFSNMTSDRFCEGCQIGYPASHNHEEWDILLSAFEDECEANPTLIPLIVPKKMLRDNPLIVDHHKDKVASLM